MSMLVCLTAHCWAELRGLLLQQELGFQHFPMHKGPNGGQYHDSIDCDMTDFRQKRFKNSWPCIACICIRQCATTFAVTLS